jgi:hypothetical protein
VTFPSETRRCIHCGRPTTASPGGAAAGPSPTPRGLLELPAEEPTGGLEPQPEARRGFSPLTLLWIALLAGGYLVRSCSGSAP